MFGLSWTQIIIIVVVGVFLLGPERIPVAVQWAVTTLRKVRNMAAGAQAQLRTEIGPELDELRKQIADLQSLKEIQELRSLRDLNPKTIIGKNILGDEFAGGLSGLFAAPAEKPVSATPVSATPQGEKVVAGTPSVAPAVEKTLAASGSGRAAAVPSLDKDPASPVPATYVPAPFDPDAT